MAESGIALLRGVNLQKHYPVQRGILKRTVGHVRAVDGVAFELRRGETLALVGESGCGKSTLGRLLLRLEEPTAGEVFLEGENLMTAPRDRMRLLRRRMQMVFQDPYSSLNPRMTVGSIVREPLDIHAIGTRDEREARTAKLLAAVGLSAEHARRFPHEFSGGQRQRVGIARALALSPSVVIADEPVSALDVSVQAQVINLFVRLQAEFDLSYVFISHDLSVVEYIADRVAVMYLGRIVEEGAKAEIFARPRHPYTRALLAAAPVPDPRRKQEPPPLHGEPPSPVHPPSGCAFHPRCPFVKEACKSAVPALAPAPGDSAGHSVACIRAGEI